MLRLISIGSDEGQQLSGSLFDSTLHRDVIGCKQQQLIVSLPAASTGAVTNNFSKTIADHFGST